LVEHLSKFGRKRFGRISVDKFWPGQAVVVVLVQALDPKHDFLPN
jgi:hypothetical protein